MNHTLLQARLLLKILGVLLLAAPAWAALELPSKLAQVPVYSGAKIVQVMDMGENSMAMLEVKADLQTVMKFYKKEMEGKGWKTVFQAEQEDSAVSHFSKDQSTIQISASKDEEDKISYQMVLMNN